MGVGCSVGARARAHGVLDFESVLMVCFWTRDSDVGRVKTRYL